ncbi:hypothetical protein [Halorhabdus sp. CUG00001]|uniref:hypothetical protein n=1 Tax=Halorhabdus sp. CUG00001 TaxID=2600297 RepID=UPI00131E10A3|nr:hypothetical protein [Halorhabdus sp. CUG00001]
MADALTGYVDEATVDREQKRAARESLKDIWADIEIKSQTKPWHVIQKQQEKRKRKRNKKRKQERKQRKQKREKDHGPEKEGKTTLYTLKSDKSSATQTLERVESNLQSSKGIRTASTQKSEVTALPALSEIINSGVSDSEPDSGTVIRPMWFRNPSHFQITGAAVDNWNSFQPPSKNDLCSWSTWPDEPDQHSEIEYNLVVPDWFPIDVFPEDGAKAYAHAFNPQYDAADYISPAPIPAGDGPNYTDQYMTTAIGKASYKHLGFALHIIEDLAVPFHTGAWARGTGLSNAQSRYENAVNASIKEDYLDHLESIDNCYVVPDSAWWDPDSGFVKHAKNIANKSTDYAHSFTTKITECDEDQPQELIDACGIKEETQHLLGQATMYAMGLIREFKRET